MNRHAIKWAILGATLIALMGPTGGFPSRPTFQTVKVNGNTTTATLNATTAGVTGTATVGTLNATTAGVTGTATVGTLNSTSLNVSGVSTVGNIISPYLRLNSLNNWQSAAAEIEVYRNGSGQTIGAGPGIEFRDFAAPTSVMLQNSGGDAAFWLLGGGGWFERMRLTNAGMLSVNGLAVPKVSYGVCNGNNTIGTGAKQNLASCSGTAGSVLVTFTSPYAVGATCTATVSGVSSNIVASVSNGAITSSFSTYTFTGNTGVANSTSFSFICVGT